MDLEKSVINNDSSFNEKILWLLKNDKNLLMVDCADKHKVKEYIKSKTGNEHLTPKTFQVANSFDLLKRKISMDQNHPEQYIIKSNNDSGGTHIVKMGLGYENIEKIKSLIERHRNKPYGVNKGEWFYGPIQYLCFSEEFLGKNLIDYKFHCSLGEPRFCQVIKDRYLKNRRKEISVDMNGNKLNFHFEADRIWDNNFEKPDTWKEMINLSKILSRDFRYVRVDFYCLDIHSCKIKNNIYIGELTFAPRAGKTPGPGQVEAGKLLPIF